MPVVGKARLRANGRSTTAVSACVALALAAAGCGGGDEQATAKPAVKSTTTIVKGEQADSGGRLTLLSRLTTKTAGVTHQEIAAIRGRLAVTARGSLTVIGFAGAKDEGLQFALSPQSTQDFAPLPVALRTDAGVVPRWARIHLGSNAGGRPVLAFPRCTEDRVGSCDVFSYDLDARREAPLEAVNTKESGESEAVVDDGAVLAVRELEGDLTADQRVTGEVRSRTTLHLARGGGKAREITDDGGRELALNMKAGRAAMVLDPRTREEDEGVCGTSHVRMIALHGEIKRDRQVTCGLAGQAPTNPQITNDRELRYGVMLNGQEGTGSSYRWQGEAATPQAQRLHLDASDWLPTSDTRGWALVGRNGCDGVWDGEPNECKLIRVIGLRPG